jgi:hypothetical protein
LIRNVVRLNGAPPGTAECILLSQEPELIDAVMDAVIRITDQIASAHGGGPLSLAPRVERKVEDIMLVAPKSSGIWGITAKVLVGGQEFAISGTAAPYARRAPSAV